MQVGLRLPQTGRGHATKENIILLAKQAENANFLSLWVLERLLCLLTHKTLIQEYTNKIMLGTSIIDMLFHNPVILARRFATLDILSEGRAICGLGIGWSKDEYRVSDIPFQYRGKRADEYFSVLKKRIVLRMLDDAASLVLEFLNSFFYTLKVIS